MTRRAKERRMERVQEKQRADEERAARDRTLASRPEWRQLLAAIDGPPPPAVQLITQVQQPSPPKPGSSSVSSATQNQIVNELQWKSTHVPIAAASVFQLPIKLDAPKGVLRYQFRTREYDVNFSVQMICADGTMIELVEPQRYESQKQLIKGHRELVGPGMVLLIWDNSFSWLNTKQLSYTIELMQETAEVSEERKTALAQRVRYERERALLNKDTELDRLQTTIQTQDQNIAFIKHQIEELQAKLLKGEEEKAVSEKQKDDVEEQIDTLVWEIRALNWRAVDKAVLHSMLALLPERDLVAWCEMQNSRNCYTSQRLLSTLSPTLVCSSSCRSLASKSWAKKIQDFRDNSQVSQLEQEAPEASA